MKNQPKEVRADYAYKKEAALNKLADVFDVFLKQFHGEDNDHIREDIANYTVGYMGVSFGLHVKR